MLDEIINLRLWRVMKARLVRLTRQPEHRGRDVTSLCRIAIDDYLAAQERELRIKPITTEEVDEMMALLIEERAGSTPKPHPPKGPVSYKAKRRRRKKSVPGLEN